MARSLTCDHGRSMTVSNIYRKEKPRVARVVCRTLVGTLVAAAMAFAAAPRAAAQTTGPTGPPRILFDTDMLTDCDDAGALAVLHALADNGEAEILATVVSVPNPWSAAC